jgi:hypothetical protein
MASPVRSTTGAALLAEIITALANWGVTLSQSQRIAFLAHLEQIILTNSATVIADVTADLAAWVEPAHGRHT